MHSVIAAWFRQVLAPTGALLGVCDVMERLSTLIDVLWFGAKLEAPWRVAKHAVENFLKAFASTFDEDHQTWKFHALLHVCQTIQKHGWSPNTLALERKHKGVIAWGDANASDCRTVLKDVVSQTLHRLAEAPWLDPSLGLVAPRRPSKKLLQFLTESTGEAEHMVSGKARFNEYDVAWVSDIVALRIADTWQVVRVLFFAETSGTPYAAVQPFECLNMSKRHSSWVKHDLPMLANVLDFVEVLIHRGNADRVDVLHPLSLVK